MWSNGVRSQWRRWERILFRLFAITVATRYTTLYDWFRLWVCGSWSEQTLLAMSCTKAQRLSIRFAFKLWNPASNTVSIYRTVQSYSIVWLKFSVWYADIKFGPGGCYIWHGLIMAIMITLEFWYYSYAPQTLKLTVSQFCVQLAPSMGTHGSHGNIAIQNHAIH